ncbi:MAG: hypothetical protein IPH11_10460 [Ignavibacteriales bacterium]|nr:hypothetical protein [Ignavibacteriales bacterium]
MGGAVRSESNDRMYNILIMKNTSTSFFVASGKLILRQAQDDSQNSFNRRGA